MLKVSISYILFIIISAFTCFLFGGKLIYSIFYSGIGILILSIIDIIIIYFSIDMDVVLDNKKIVTKENIKIKYKIRNKGFFFIPFFIIKNKALQKNNFNYNGEVVSLGIKKDNVIVFEYSFNKRGVYNLGELTVELKDVFSILTIKKKFNKRKNIYVYPNIYLIKDNSYDKKIFFNNEFSKLMECREIRNIREYEKGDSIKDIHWKITAKKSKLYIKNKEN
ncbi:MAG: DUF58 domain-containing protein, partial [Clostridiaceae bacterium]